MDHDEKLKLVETMKRFGGSFVKALAECILLADMTNLSKLQKVFPQEFKTYGKNGPFQKR